MAARALSPSVRKSDLATPGRSVFQGDSSRVWHALRTCQKSGAAMEIFVPARSLRRKALEAVVLIAAGIVLLSFVGRMM